METSNKSFVGTSPGQSLEALVERMSQYNLGIVLGKDVLELIDALKGVPDKQATLRGIAVTFLRDRANEVMVRPEIRATCLDTMSVEKLSELAGHADAASLGRY